MTKVRDKMLGNVSLGWAGLHLGWQQETPSAGSRQSWSGLGELSNPNAKQAALETNSQKWPGYSPGPAKTWIASGL